MKSESWEWTDDPKDLCALCVNWMDDPADEFGQRSIPMLSPGVPATKLFRGEHKKCSEMVSQYLADVKEG